MRGNSRILSGSTNGTNEMTVDPNFAMNRGVDITLSVLSIINLFLQVPGLHFLDKKRIQHLYIMGLSLSEVLICIVRFANTVTRMSLQDRGYEHSYIREVDRYFEYLIFTGLSLLYYVSMVMITIDRYMICALSVNYSRYWNRRRARILLYVIGAASALFYIGSEISYQLTGQNIELYFMFCFYLPFDAVFVAAALLTYSRIFYQYVSISRRAHSHRDVNMPATVATRDVEVTEAQSSSRSIAVYFRESRFYVAFFLVATFFLFIITADLVYLGAIYVGKSEYSAVILNVIRISYMVSFLCDGLIYIMLDPHVRSKMFKMLSIKQTTSSSAYRGGSTDEAITN